LRSPKEMVTASKVSSAYGRASASPVTVVAGDALALPFADETFDAVTISFGLRNVSDVDRALAELLRVTKVGGRLVICEFSHLPVRTLDRILGKGLEVGLPLVARGLSDNPDAYAYLSESIEAWPDQPALARRIQAAGWSRVEIGRAHV